MLLHIGNKLSFNPLAYAINVKETYKNSLILFKKIRHEEHGWNVCADLRVIAMLTGLQAGYTKVCCFLCEWDYRYRMKKTTQGQKNGGHHAVVDKSKICLPPLV